MCYRDGRISGSGLDRGVGGALARAAWTGFVRAAQTLASADRRGRQAAASLAP